MLPRIAVLCGLEGDGGGRDQAPHAYSEAVAAGGGAPLLVPCMADEEQLRSVLDVCQGLLITGGVDVDPQCYGNEPHRALGQISPERDRLDEVAVAWAMSDPGLPVLGICRGIQSLNAFCGGTLIQDIPSEVTGALKHGQQAPRWHGTHTLTVESGTLLAEIVGTEPLLVNTFHHQAVREAAPGWSISARAADGVVEAIEDRAGTFRVGVQCHPEHMIRHEPRLLRLFERFIAEAKRALV
jgi:putative glutamine amidotransferase